MLFCIGLILESSKEVGIAPAHSINSKGLVAGCHSFCLFSYFLTYMHSFNHSTFICRHSLKPLSISSSLVCSVGKTSLWCRAKKNQTQACHTASRRELSHAAPLKFCIMQAVHQVVFTDVLLVGQLDVNGQGLLLLAYTKWTLRLIGCTKACWESSYKINRIT